MRFIVSILLNAVIVLVASELIAGVQTDSFTTAIIVSLLLALVNFFIKPILTLLTLPITILTLGLFLLVINGLMILLVDGLVDGFSVDGLWVAILFAIVLAILNALVGVFLPSKKSK